MREREREREGRKVYLTISDKRFPEKYDCVCACICVCVRAFVCVFNTH